MARLYSNENFPLPVVDELRRLGHDVLTMQELSQAGKGLPDEDVLTFANAQGRQLLTFNRKHFIRLHRQNQEHCGIIACTVDADFVRLARHIDAAIAQNAAQSPQDDPRRYLRVNRPAG